MTRLVVHVVPRSSRSGAAGRHDGLPKLRVKAPPADGAANTEAERTLTSLLGAKTQLVAGSTSRRKTFEVAIDSGDLERRLREVFG